MTRADKTPVGPPGEIRPVHKVVRLVATHPDSWEDAARAAIAEATKSIRDLSNAKVTQLDTVLDNGRISHYRVGLEMVFRVDRLRPSPIPGEPDVVVHRSLVVANKTLASTELIALLEQRARTQPVEIHVLVPATYSTEEKFIRQIALGGDPFTGHMAAEFALIADGDDRAVTQAQERLDEQLARLEAAGFPATGEIGSAEPVDAISRIMNRASFDEIVLVTLPAGLSRWIKLDLPHRVDRAFDLPVTHITTEG